ncbi:hypothetical protein [Deinococcus sp. QL22]|uniref:hypothetical protein n=1 Tax=Deinococcus sp. QL22 TaxID=2939437 RepID=UPI002017A07E|nr:hypothetical protein [Deinococcus sp. QL22]UQN07401.1 hypothetical protein M1R55_05765 [Deinococcus sp. QL22]
MNDSTAPRAITRTWEAHLTYRECSVITGTATHTVTLTRTPAGLEATVDGEASELARAVRILGAADALTLTAETLELAPIGKARASKLHRLMARYGVPTKEHYAFASAALDAPVYSLALLSEPDARNVWRFLCQTHAPSFAA